MLCAGASVLPRAAPIMAWLPPAAQQQSRVAAAASCQCRSAVTTGLRHGDLLFASEPLLELELPLFQAVREVGRASVEWLQGRGATPSSGEDLLAKHVAMVIADASGRATSVVEAVRLLGVRTISLESFFDGFAQGTRFLHGRVKGVNAEQRRKAVSYALVRTGAPYANDFSPPSASEAIPWNQAHYCSSLVDYAYRSALEQDLVFTEEPFPLVFEPRGFWEKYYNDQGQSLPRGFGSNPTMLLHSPRVDYSEVEVRSALRS